MSLDPALTVSQGYNQGIGRTVFSFGELCFSSNGKGQLSGLLRVLGEIWWRVVGLKDWLCYWLLAEDRHWVLAATHSSHPQAFSMGSSQHGSFLLQGQQGSFSLHSLARLVFCVCMCLGGEGEQGYIIIQS